MIPVRWALNYGLRLPTCSLKTRNLLPIADTGTSTRHAHRLTSTWVLNQSRNGSSHSDLAGSRDHALIPSPAEQHTIFALSTPPGKGAIAIIRISGPRSRELSSKLLRPTTKVAPDVLGDPSTQPWKLKRCRVVDPGTEQVLDDALAVFFRSKCGSCVCCARISNRLVD
jgi:hypothetical protein